MHGQQIEIDSSSDLELQFENSLDELYAQEKLESSQSETILKPWERIMSQSETRTFKAQYAVEKAKSIKKRNEDLTEMLRRRAQEMFENPDHFFDTFN